MKLIDQTKQFEQLAAALGNPYAAVRYISKKARRLTSKYNNYILDSEAISWVLTGEKPNSAIEYDTMVANRNYLKSISTQYVISVVDEYLSYVDDEGVCKSVRASIKASRESRHLVYVYIDIDDDYQHARVRIITRMIWYSL